MRKSSIDKREPPCPFCLCFYNKFDPENPKKMERTKSPESMEVTNLCAECPLMIENKKRRMKADKKSKVQKEYYQKKMMKKQEMENQATSRQDDIHTTDENNEHNSTTIGDNAGIDEYFQHHQTYGHGGFDQDSDGLDIVAF